MRKVLILRTFNVKRVWERSTFISSAMYRYSQFFGQILKWEPDFAALTKDDLSLALGIYTSMYYSTNQCSTENQPSIIKMIPREQLFQNTMLIESLSWGVSFKFRVLGKLEEFTRDKMLELDNKLIATKKEELIQKSNTVPLVNFTPLSFTLDEKRVLGILRKFGVDNIPVISKPPNPIPDYDKSRYAMSPMC